jgi:hypothetical protein
MSSCIRQDGQVLCVQTIRTRANWEKSAFQSAGDDRCSISLNRSIPLTGWLTHDCNWLSIGVSAVAGKVRASG